MPQSTCTVWWSAPLDPDKAPQLVALLDKLELDRLRGFRRQPDQARYLTAHALARIVLGEALDCPPAELSIDRSCRCGQQHGKPALAGDGPSFSLTHAGDVTGVAMYDGGPIGLDVEKMSDRFDLPALARRVGSPAELVRDRLTEPRSFFRMWTAKEALLKATGDGLSRPMASITLDADLVPTWTADATPGRAWVHPLHPADGYAAAVAGLGTSPSAVDVRDGQCLLRRYGATGGTDLR